MIILFNNCVHRPLKFSLSFFFFFCLLVVNYYHSILPDEDWLFDLVTTFAPSAGIYSQIMWRLSRISLKRQLALIHCQHSNLSTTSTTRLNDDIFSNVDERRKLDQLTSKASEQNFSSFYKSYIESTDAETQVAASFDEQKSFRSIFDYLNESSMRRTNKSIVQGGLNFLQNSNEIPLSARTQNPGMISSVSGILKKDDLLETQDAPFSFARQRMTEFLSAEYQKKNWSKIQTDSKISEALALNIKYINDSISDNEQMIYYIKHKLIEPFLKFERESVDSLTSPSHPLGEEITISAEALRAIKEQSEMTPDTPLVNFDTLSVLVRYCFNSLTYDFDSLEDTLAIFDFIKFHQSINLYSRACDVDLYNSILKQIWTKTQNTELIKEIIDEMKTNIIDPNIITFKIICTIYLNCMKVTDDGTAYPFLLWGNAHNVYGLKSFVTRVSQMAIPESNNQNLA